MLWFSAPTTSPSASEGQRSPVPTDISRLTHCPLMLGRDQGQGSMCQGNAVVTLTCLEACPWPPQSRGAETVGVGTPSPVPVGPPGTPHLPRGLVSCIVACFKFLSHKVKMFSERSSYHSYGCSVPVDHLPALLVERVTRDKSEPCYFFPDRAEQ